MPLDGTLAAPFLANNARLWRLDLATAWRPAPAVDLNRWAVDNLEFGPESPFPGRYDPDLFPFYRHILDLLSPEDPVRKVTLLKSAQTGGTLLAQIFAAGSMDLDPGPTLHVHPTESNATGYARTKWRPMLRVCPRLGEVFETRQSKEGGNSTLHQERKDGRGWYRLSGANSAASLSMYSVERLIKDDLSKWEDNDAGDPELQAESRTKAFRSAKIFEIGTPLLQTNCRTTRSFAAGTQEHLHVPCPHCGHMHPLEPENFIATIVPEHPERAGFTCPACGGAIEEKHRAEMVREGHYAWVAYKPEAPDVSLTIWAAYFGIEPWARIAQAYLDAQGDPKTEQVWWNDTAGRAYELPGEAPAWEALKARAEPVDAAGRRPDGRQARPRGVVPYGALILTLTLDCQDEFVEGAIIGWGRNLTRFVIDRVQIGGHISMPETRAMLNQLVEQPWPTEAGTLRRVDLVGIDANAWTDEVHDWAQHWPRSRVMMVRGIGGDAAPTLAVVGRERRADGKRAKYQGRFFNIGVSGLKGGLYKFLRVEEAGERGYVDFPAGLEDEYYEQLTAEKRTPRIDRKGFTTYEWRKPRSRRNEQLDVMVYAEALAVRKGWRLLTPQQWDALAAEREIAAAHTDDTGNLGLSATALLPRPGGRPAAARPPAPVVSSAGAGGRRVRSPGVTL